MLSAAGIASIHFSPKITQASLARFVRGFPTGSNTKPTQLAEQLKAALDGDPHVHVNEVCFVPADSAVAKSTVAAQLAARTLGMNAEQTDKLLNDPEKLLQLIVAAEGTKSGTDGTGTGGSGGSGSGGGPGTAGGTGWFTGPSGSMRSGGGQAARYRDGSGSGGGSGGFGGPSGGGTGTGAPGGGYGAGSGSGSGSGGFGWPVWRTAPGPEGLAEDTEPDQGGSGSGGFGGPSGGGTGSGAPGGGYGAGSGSGSGSGGFGSARLAAAQGAACRLDRVTEPVAAPAGREVVQAAATGWML